MNLAAKLTADILTVCPIDGLSIGRKTDKTSWRIDFKPEATAQQRAAAQAVIDAFDLAGYNAQAAATDQRVATDETERKACAVDAAILPLVNQDKPTWIAWAKANFPSLTVAEQTRLGTLFWVVSIGVRRAIRNGG